MKSLLVFAALFATIGLTACNAELTPAQKEYVALREKCANKSDTSKECLTFRQQNEPGEGN